MPSPELLSHSIVIGEEEVHRLIGKAKPVLEVQPARFGGRVELWARECEARDGQIDEVVTYMVNGHRVSYVENQGIDPDTEEEFDVFHVACDCALGYVDAVAPSELVPKVVQCGNTQIALQRRAAWVDHTYRTSEMLYHLRDETTGDFEQSNDYHILAMNSLAYVLELDALHPEEWPATIISGQHQASIMSTMLQLHPDVVRWYGQMMERAGVIEFDGETMRLTDSRYQEMVDALEDN